MSNVKEFLTKVGKAVVNTVVEPDRARELLVKVLAEPGISLGLRQEIAAYLGGGK